MGANPVFTVLTHAECETLLASQHVGRMAFTFRDRVNIEPIHYVYRDGWIWGRTQYGTKVEMLAHHPWVAFPDPDGSVQDQERFARGVEAFRTLVPEAFAVGDPTPSRELVFMIPAAEIEGRAARPGPG
jgi:hypothetical protein